MDVLAVVQSSAEALKALCVFLVSPEGQLTVKSWRESADRWNADIANAGKWAEALFKRP